MDSELNRRLDGLPQLDRHHAQTGALRCKICNSDSHFVGAIDFWKCAGGHPFGRSGISVDWYSCSRCEFLFTNFFDSWAPGDFSRYVYNDDYIKVDPDYVGTRSKGVFESLKPFMLAAPNARVLDYGSGSGILSQLLREHNIDATSYDPFSSPERPAGRFDIIICVEVLEHSPNPTNLMDDIATLISDDGCIILGISLHPQNIKQLGPAWWYCAPRNGHCSTFSAATLAQLGGRCGLTFHLGRNTHWCAWRPSGRVSDIAKAIGPAFKSFQLTAPKDGGPGWHGLEKNFRWSASEIIEWKIDIEDAPAIVRAKLAYHMEPARGFAEKCKLLINGAQATAIGPNTTVDIGLDSPGPVTARLENAALVCPADHGSTDQRKLGLALLIE